MNGLLICEPGIPCMNSDVSMTMIQKRDRITNIQVSWCPCKPGMLASSDDRGLVFVWDMDKADGSGVDSAPVPQRPELRMVHPGHAAAVGDLRW